nr:MAG TPA: hypothetical protein [Caudoviricetes sp.]DAY74517.1 MAG TPA: hypothetical protein [Caudoviricetes sp.]
MFSGHAYHSFPLNTRVDIKYLYLRETLVNIAPENNRVSDYEETLH